MEIKTVGVVGAGLMGSGIVEQAAKCGFDVIVREIDDDQLRKGEGKIAKSMAVTSLSKGLDGEDHGKVTGGRLSGRARRGPAGSTRAS